MEPSRDYPPYSIDHVSRTSTLNSRCPLFGPSHCDRPQRSACAVDEGSALCIDAMKQAKGQDLESISPFNLLCMERTLLGRGSNAVLQEYRDCNSHGKLKANKHGGM